MKPRIKIDVVSDVVCPWCYIGKRRLEKAIESLSAEYDFDVRYHPFELNPALPDSGTDQKQYLTRKFGSEERYNELTSRVTDIASIEGVVFDFESQAVLPNTRRLHSLIRFAGTKGLQKELVEVLFNSYFTSGIDLSDADNIVKAAEEAGLDHDQARQILLSDEESRITGRLEQEIYKLGITGVPFFIVNDKYGISGAQTAETFEKAFKEIHRQAVPAGDVCDTDNGNC